MRDRGHRRPCARLLYVAGVDADAVEWLYQTPDSQCIGVHYDSELWTVVLLAPGDYRSESTTSASQRSQAAAAMIAPELQLLRKS